MKTKTTALKISKMFFLALYQHTTSLCQLVQLFHWPRVFDLNTYHERPSQQISRVNVSLFFVRPATLTADGSLTYCRPTLTVKQLGRCTLWTGIKFGVCVCGMQQLQVDYTRELKQGGRGGVTWTLIIRCTEIRVILLHWLNGTKANHPDLKTQEIYFVCFNPY